MKKLISFLLVAAIVCSMCATFAFTGNAAIEQQFIVDGNLDIWYLSNDETDEDDPNYYHYISLEAKLKDGVSYYDAPETAAQVWTAWDDDYIYIYVKVWDDELIDYDENGKHSAAAGAHSGFADSIELWVDPDPNSQTHSFVYDNNRVIIEEVEKPKDQVSDGFCNQTGDETQGDVQLRLIGYDMQRHDYHNKVNPGYDCDFATWVNNPENVCGFTFDNDPVVVDGTGETVSSGYGVEARFPRNNDSSGHYRFNIACNNSSEWSSERYSLCVGAAWWLNYETAWQVKFFDGIENPFFNQPEEQLKAKKTQYTDSEINQKGAANDVVTGIDALPETVTDANKATVEGLIASYNALTDVEKGYVAYKNADALKAAADALGIEFELSTGDEVVVTPGVTVEDIIAMINELPDEVTLDDADKVEQIGRLMDKLTEEELEAFDDAAYAKIQVAALTIAYLQLVDALGDVNDDDSIDAKDALLVLQAAVDKAELTEGQAFSADVNFDGTIDAKDALEILQVAVDARETFSGLEAGEIVM